jgi:hypothetical protein
MLFPPFAILLWFLRQSVPFVFSACQTLQIPFVRIFRLLLHHEQIHCVLEVVYSVLGGLCYTKFSGVYLFSAGIGPRMSSESVSSGGCGSLISAWFCLTGDSSLSCRCELSERLVERLRHLGRG